MSKYLRINDELQRAIRGGSDGMAVSGGDPRYAGTGVNPANRE